MTNTSKKRNKIIKQIKRKIKLLLSFCKLYFLSFIHNKKCNVLIDASNLVLGRRMAQITIQLKNSGYYPCIKIHLKDYVCRELASELHSDIALATAHVFTVRNVRDPFIFSISHIGKKNHYEKSLIINNSIDEFKYHLNDRFFFPILMHPKYMLLDSFEDEKQLITNCEKKIGILFIGNTAGFYNNNLDTFHNRFGLYSRIETLNFIMNKFPEYVERPDSEDELLSMIENGTLKRKIVIIDKFTVDRNYMYLYSISIFHLWTVGFWQPYCHNQIESMSCGAIPLFQDFPYYPGLINGFNCISYSDFTGLCNEVNKILEGIIPQNELVLMSSRINELYNTHYSKKAIKRAFDSFVEDSNILHEEYYICPKEN